MSDPNAMKVQREIIDVDFVPATQLEEDNSPKNNFKHLNDPIKKILKERKKLLKRAREVEDEEQQLSDQYELELRKFEQLRRSKIAQIENEIEEQLAPVRERYNTVNRAIQREKDQILSACDKNRSAWMKVLPN